MWKADVQGTGELARREAVIQDQWNSSFVQKPADGTVRKKTEKKGDIDEWQTLSIYACQDVPSKTQQEANVTVIKMGKWWGPELKLGQHVLS